MIERTKADAHEIAGRRVVGFIGMLILLTSFVWGVVAEAGTKDKDDDKEKAIHVYTSGDHGDKGYLGVKMQELDSDLRKGLDITIESGVLISEVMEGSPAEAAGIEDGDVIIEFNGEKVDSPSALQELVAATESGDTIELKVFRDNKEKTYEVTIGDWPEDYSWNMITPEHMVWFDKGKDVLFSSFGRSQLGVHVAELNEDLAPYFNAKEGEGVLVTSVVGESTAEEMGIKAGDVIVNVADEEVGSREELVDAIHTIEPGEKFEVTVIRKKKSLRLEGEMQESAAASYVKAFKGHAGKMKMPHMKMHDVYQFSDDEMEELKSEMKELREEMDKMRDELRKLERKTR
jgi:C-terminal processing protease CtpA/Prc